MSPPRRAPLLALLATLALPATVALPGQAAALAQDPDEQPSAAPDEQREAKGGAKAKANPKPKAKPETKPKPETKREPDKKPQQAEPDEAEAPADDTWLDASHRYIGARLLAPAVIFDRFFSDETELELERSQSFLRWRNELRFEEGGRPAYTTSVRANLRMPAMNRWLRRLRLVIAGETRDALAALFPDEVDDDSDRTSRGADAELRFGLWDGLMSHADIGAGLLLDLPPGVFTQLRLRWAFPVGDLFLTRFAPRGFWRSDTRFGSAADLHLERAVLQAGLLRLSSRAQITQRSNGVEWGSDLAFLVAFDSRSAGLISAGVTGKTGGGPAIERYRVATRLRRDFYRRWLFFELEPEVFWPIPDQGIRRHALWATTVRLEVQFHGAPPEASAPAPRERDDPPAREKPAPARPGTGS